MELRDGWNARNDIGGVLESKARQILGSHTPYGADGTIYEANTIVGGSFVEVMVYLLRFKSNLKDNEEIDSFVEDISSSFGKSVYDIGDEKSQLFLDRFIELLSKDYAE